MVYVEWWTSSNIPHTHGFIKATRNQKIRVRVVIQAEDKICVTYQGPSNGTLASGAIGRGNK